jgi:hypothetical protein
VGPKGRCSANVVPRQNILVGNNMRIVVSTTTIPGRYDILEELLDSLAKQSRKADCIYLGVPDTFSRTGEKYPPLPESITSRVTVVKLDRDYGPICKILGALIREKDPRTLIVTVDDDTLLESKHLQAMEEQAEMWPDDCICGTGSLMALGMFFFGIRTTLDPYCKWWCLPLLNMREERGLRTRRVDIAFGVGTVGYRRGFFPDYKTFKRTVLTKTKDRAIFCNDDVMLSAHLESKGIVRRAVPLPSIKHRRSAHALSEDIYGMIVRMNKAFSTLRNEGYYSRLEPMSYTDSVMFWVILVTIAVLVVIAIAIYIAVRWFRHC